MRANVSEPGLMAQLQGAEIARLKAENDRLQRDNEQMKTVLETWQSNAEYWKERTTKGRTLVERLRSERDAVLNTLAKQPPAPAPRLADIHEALRIADDPGHEWDVRQFQYMRAAALATAYIAEWLEAQGEAEDA